VPGRNWHRGRGELAGITHWVTDRPVGPTFLATCFECPETAVLVGCVVVFVGAFVVEVNQPFLKDLDLGQLVETQPEVLVFSSPATETLVVTAHFAIQRSIHADAAPDSLPCGSAKLSEIVSAARLRGSQCLRSRLIEVFD